MRGEGTDYVTENENVPTLQSSIYVTENENVPNLQSLIISYRNHQKLVKNYEEVFKKAGVTDPATESTISHVNY